MRPVTNFAMMALASALLAPVVVGATASALPVIAAAHVEAAAISEPACARKVKVVYATYGSTGCALAESTR
jgi:hypothetical protein